MGQSLGGRLRFYRAEKIACALTVFTVATLALFLRIYPASVAYQSFLIPIAAAAFVLALGASYRVSGRSDRISTSLIACTMLLLFMAAGAALNFVMLGRKAPIIDSYLFAADRWLGFDWVRFLDGLSAYPAFSKVLAAIYLSSIPQLIIVLLTLGFLGMRRRLHFFLLTGMICSLTCIAIWYFIPSFGPSAYITIAPEVEARLGRVVGADMGQYLLKLHENGPSIIHFDHLIGLIAFPSMHTVMALMCTWPLRGTWLLWPMAGINILMIPAIIVHGGHHATDLIGGAILFLVVASLVHWILPITETITAPNRG